MPSNTLTSLADRNIEVHFFVEDISALGGVQKHVLDFRMALEKADVKVHLVSRYNSIHGERKLSDLTLYEVGDETQEQISKRVSAYTDSLGPNDVIIAPQYGMLYELDLAGRLASKRKFKVIGAYHSSFNYARDRPYFNLLNALLKKTDATVFLTEDDRANFAGMGIPHSVTIPNAIEFLGNLDHITRRDHCIYMGRLDEEKGVRELLDVWITAFQQREVLPPLKIFGSGQLEQELAEDIKSTGVPNVHLMGRTSSPLVELSRARLTVSCSPREGFPMTLLESCSVGTPSVVYDAGPGTRELVQKHDTGFVVPPGDTEGFKAAIKKLQYPETWNRKSSNSCEVATSYAPDRIYSQWEELILKLVESDSNQAPESKNGDEVVAEWEPRRMQKPAKIKVLLNYGRYREKSLLLTVKAFDQDGIDISRRALTEPYSEVVGAHFINSHAVNHGDDPVISFELTPVEDVARYEFKLLRWGRGEISPRTHVRRMFVETISNGQKIIRPLSSN